MKYTLKRLSALFCALCVVVSLSTSTVSAAQTALLTSTSAATSAVDSTRSLSTLPTYTGDAYVVINDNEPSFTDSEKKNTTAFERYSDLDALGRCGTAYANICKEIMPTQDRENISAVHPSGWQSINFWQRCHLIAFCLAGENANQKNLITGTDYFNHKGMLPFENMVADYVKETNHHVLYRVTPYFEGDNLVASGVEMEGWSVEDDGDGICFHVYAFNVEPNTVIDYRTGMITKADAQPSTITLKEKSVTYNGNPVSIAKAVVTGSTGKITYTYYTDSTCKTKTTAKNSGASSTGGAPVNAGTYYVKAAVAADTSYLSAESKAAKLTIKKAAPKISFRTLSKEYSTTQLKTAACVFDVTPISPAGKVTCKKSSGSSALSVSTAGKVTVKKGTAAGKYTAKVKFSTSAASNYSAASVTKTITVTVKNAGTSSTNTNGVSANTTVYVSSSGKMHLKKDCSGMKNYSTTTYAKGTAKGYTQCTKCF